MLNIYSWKLFDVTTTRLLTSWPTQQYHIPGRKPGSASTQNRGMHLAECNIQARWAASNAKLFLFGPALMFVCSEIYSSKSLPSQLHEFWSKVYASHWIKFMWRQTSNAAFKHQKGLLCAPCHLHAHSHAGTCAFNSTVQILSIL